MCSGKWFYRAIIFGTKIIARDRESNRAKKNELPGVRLVRTNSTLRKRDRDWESDQEKQRERNKATNTNLFTRKQFSVYKLF